MGGADGLRDANDGAAAAPAALLRYALGCALADCIEADGHRVCDVGVRQRLVAAGRGHLPEVGPELPPVGQLLAELGAGLAAACGDAEPSATRLHAFYRGALARAAHLYRSDASLERQFAAQLATFLHHDYGWAPPAPRAGLAQ